MPACQTCQIQFDITPAENKLRDKMAATMSIKELAPQPLCHACRNKQKMILRNELYLYSRKCDFTGKNIISVYDQNQKFPVYANEIWYGDQWDPLDYKQNYDFTQHFFQQFESLFNKTPRAALRVMKSENCQYTNFTYDCQNCYLATCSYYSQNLIYCYWSLRAENNIDCTYIIQSQHCLNCMDCTNSYNCNFSQLISNCSDSYFLYDCKGCRNCFGCVGLRNKEYHLFNQAFSKEEYQTKIQEWNLQNPEHLQKIQTYIADLKLRQPRLYSQQEKSENCTGDFLTNCQNCINCFGLGKSQDCINNQDCETKDSLDCYHIGWSENTYQCYSLGNQQNTAFSFLCLTGSENYYCSTCTSCNNCFGCVGLTHKNYCILNKQYSKEEYETLLPRIIEHMKSTGEWGHYFPIQLSPFGYNETMAQIYYPLTKEEALQEGYTWKDNLPFTTGKETIQWSQIPYNTQEVSASICQEILACQTCQRNYKIIPQELKIYQDKQLSLPRNCPNCRLFSRMKLRNPYTLYDRNCQKCQTPIQTTYSPNKPETVYCEQCYLETLY